MSEIMKLLFAALGKEAAKLVYQWLVERDKDPEDITLQDLLEKTLSDGELRRLRRALAIARISAKN